jgi:hypothetical protein
MCSYLTFMKRIFLSIFLLSTILSCGGSHQGQTAAVGTVSLSSVPACSASDLTPFNPGGSFIRPSQLPQGQYTYMSGNVYIETISGFSPPAKMHLLDTQPNTNNYPGQLICLTITTPHPAFMTGSYIYRIANVMSDRIDFSFNRGLTISSNGTTLVTNFFTDDLTRTMTIPEVIADENARLARGERVEVYQTGANAWRLVVVRNTTAMGVTSRIHIAANYTKSP